MIIQLSGAAKRKTAVQWIREIRKAKTAGDRKKIWGRIPKIQRAGIIAIFPGVLAFIAASAPIAARKAIRAAAVKKIVKAAKARRAARAAAPVAPAPAPSQSVRSYAAAMTPGAIINRPAPAPEPIDDTGADYIEETAPEPLDDTGADSVEETEPELMGGWIKDTISRLKKMSAADRRAAWKKIPVAKRALIIAAAPALLPLLAATVTTTTAALAPIAIPTGTAAIPALIARKKIIAAKKKRGEKLTAAEKKIEAAPVPAPAAVEPAPAAPQKTTIEKAVPIIGAGAALIGLLSAIGK